MGLVEEHVSTRNATRAARAWAASPVGRLARIEVLVTVSCLLLGVLVLLGSGRRGSRSTAFRLAVWSSLMLSYQAVSYTIGLMQSASFRNDLVVVWGCFLLLLLGCADGISAYNYSLSGSDQQARTVLNQGLQLVYVFLLLLSYVDALPLQLKVALLLLWVLSAAKLGVRLRSCLVASRRRALTVDSKFVADYMLREHEPSGADYDAATMAGYRYLVTGSRRSSSSASESSESDQDEEQEVVTLDLVWQCKGRLLRSDDSDTRRRKDLCLSFALFRLLLRRLGGFQLHEARLNKTRDLVKVGLLGGGGDHRRMYRVLEVELGFLFDLFYARYPSPDRSLLPDTLLFVAVVATTLFALFSPALSQYSHRTTTSGGGGGGGGGGDNANNTIIAATSTAFDIWLTRMVMTLFALLESFQYLSLVFSDWNKVKMLCRYVRDESWQQQRPVLERLLSFMCHVRLAPYWNNSVGQHCLLYACFQTEQSCLLRLPLPGCVRGSLARTKTTRHRRLTAVVKLAIYRFLRSGGLTRIRNGDHTLAACGMLSSDDGDCDTTAAERILVWHVATTICDSRAGTTARDAAVVEHHEVATTLSAYCAYLVSSAPELLPGNGYDARLLFRAVQLRVRRRLRGCQSRDDMYTSLAGFDPEGGDDVYDAMLVRGKMLGDAVQHKMPDPAVRWKVLADLWVEMLLSVAPSSNVDAHVQKLATGGELITHLWALLTHAGIIEEPINRHRRRAP